MASDQRKQPRTLPQKPVENGTRYLRTGGYFDRQLSTGYSQSSRRPAKEPMPDPRSVQKTGSKTQPKSQTVTKPAQPKRKLTKAELEARRLRAEQRKKAEKRKRRNRRLGVLFTILGLLFLVYLALCWLPWRSLSPHSPFHSFQAFMIQNSRESHSYLWVQYFFPDYVREPYVEADRRSRAAQLSFNSDRSPAEIILSPPADGQPLISDHLADQISEVRIQQMSEDQLRFYQTFYQLDIASMEAYLEAHPEALRYGYQNLYINEAGLHQKGTEIRTTGGEQVLAIDAANGVLLVRVQGRNYRGVLAIAKDSGQLHLFTSKYLSDGMQSGGYGQTAGELAEDHNGILAISASGFLDENGVGTGGALVGFCRSDGVDHGSHRYWGSKRLELREDGWLYITEAMSECRVDVTNAMEFEPALIVNGERLESYVYTADNPRACVGQTDKGEILMLAIEGRLADSAGCSVGECTSILQRYRAVTAMNMDGGTSAMLWFDGAPVIRCSNQNTPEGRYLPNAWVYVRKQ